MIDDVLAKIRAKDPFYDDGYVLSSMVSKPLEIAVKAFLRFIDTNAGDYSIFRNLARMERCVIRKLSLILGCESKRCSGYIVSGGSEANFLSLWLIRNFSRKAKGIRRPEIVISPTTHYSVIKAANALNIKVKYASLNENYKIDVASIPEKISKNTIAIIGNVGSTELGFVDDIQSLSKIASEYNVALHLDAAYGGFILPFINSRIFPGFRCENVLTITSDPHKTLFTPIPSGGFFVKDKALLKYIRFKPKYLSKTPSETLTGTRCGASIAAIYAVIRFVWLNKIGEIHKKCYENALYFYNKIAKSGLFKTFGKPETPIVCFKPYSVDVNDVLKRLRTKGWIIYKCNVVNGLRIVFMPHVSREVIDKFFSDLLEVISM